MKVTLPAKRKSRIEMIPLIDIVFLLLVVFIYTMPITTPLATTILVALFHPTIWEMAAMASISTPLQITRLKTEMLSAIMEVMVFM